MKTVALVSGTLFALWLAFFLITGVYIGPWCSGGGCGFVIGNPSAIPQHKAEPPARASSWTKEPTDFKGFKFGMSFKEAKLARVLGHCYGSSKRRTCEFAAEPITFAVTFTDDKLASISGRFAATAFEEIERQFIAKFGDPQLDNAGIIQNAFGAVFEQHELFWSGRKMHISLDKFARSYRDDIPGGGKQYDLTKGGIWISPSKDEEGGTQKSPRKNVLD